ncbi:MAG: hypothetical protein ACE14P_14970 [Methanotrichaceae archaeon]
MISRKAICVLFISLMITAVLGCVAQETTSLPSVPTKNLPDGFKLAAVETKSTQGINMTDEIKDFYGAKDIGKVDATVGRYWWGDPGTTYVSKITLISTGDEAHAQAAMSNYISQPDFQMPPYRGTPRFSYALVNGHNTTEIRDEVGDNGLRYLYIWNKGNIVVLVEGNGDRSKSLELASATGL